MWLGTDAGLCRYNRGTQTFTWYEPKQGETNLLSTTMVKSIVGDAQGAMWIGPSVGVVRLSDDTTARFHTGNSGLSRDSVPCLTLSGGGIWIGTDNGIRSDDFAPGRFRALPPDSSTHYGLAHRNRRACGTN